MRKPLIIGHRGASAVAPENTLAAFSAAVDAGADGIEFDVRLSRDGVPVVIHDETLQRTVGLRTRVADLSVEELQRVDVPSLRQLFELMSHNSMLLYLEIKSSPAERVRLAEACCRLVDEFRLTDRVIVECFDLAVLEIIRELKPRIKTAALFDSRLSTTRRIIDQALAAGASELALHHRLANHRLIERAKLAGFKVVVWTVDDPAWVKRALAIGIEALITNDPTRLIEATDRIRVQLN